MTDCVGAAMSPLVTKRAQPWDRVQEARLCGPRLGGAGHWGCEKARLASLLDSYMDCVNEFSAGN